MKPQIDICLSPALSPAYQSNSNTIVVVVDIFRATSSICTALANGAEGIIPVVSIEEALSYKRKGYLVAAERDTKKCDFADFGNSPLEFTKEKVEKKTIVFTTTNGTTAVFSMNDYNELIAGSFLNIAAVASYCSAKGKDILVICSGEKNRVNLEDSLFAGALVEYVSKDYAVKSDTANMMLAIWNEAKNNLFEYGKKSEHAIRLSKYSQEDDVMYCLQQNMFNFVPVFKFGCFKLFI